MDLTKQGKGEPRKQKANLSAYSAAGASKKDKAKLHPVIPSHQTSHWPHTLRYSWILGAVSDIMSSGEAASASLRAAKPTNPL